MKHLLAVLAVCATTNTHYTENVSTTLLEELLPLVAENRSTNISQASKAEETEALPSYLLEKFPSEVIEALPFDSSQICILAPTQNAEAIPSFLLEDLQSIPSTEEQVPDFSNIKIGYVRRYVELIYPMALKIQKKHRIPLAVTIAIACLESGYGRSYNAKNKFNHLGIRSFQQGKPGYRRFSSTADCFEYYSGMFTKKRYLPLQEIKGEDHLTWITKLCECGYNPFKKYIKEIMVMIRFIHLDKKQHNTV